MNGSSGTFVSEKYGCDSSGTGSRSSPFRTVKRALRDAEDGNVFVESGEGGDFQVCCICWAMQFLFRELCEISNNTVLCLFRYSALSDYFWVPFLELTPSYERSAIESR